jgi:hypothetical protein
MLDRVVVEVFLDWQFEDSDIEIPTDISKSTLVETFCLYTEDDYYEWLKDNFKSFFNHSEPNWNWIRGRIQYYQS